MLKKTKNKGKHFIGKEEVRAKKQGKHSAGRVKYKGRHSITKER